MRFTKHSPTIVGECLVKNFMEGLRTWIEIDAKALRSNAERFLKLIPKTTRLMAVIKSNAYGHGLVQVAKLLAGSRIKNQELGDKKLWFGVDSIVEALRLRREGITNPILVFGFTLPSRLKEAGTNGIALTISNFESLKAVAALKKRPPIHLKIDTGMHRQGFLPDQTSQLLTLLKRHQLVPAGLYTHLASAKDPDDLFYSQFQLAQFQKSILAFRQSGFRNLMCHAAATGAALLFPESHLDMVRIGMGLYGYSPSKELGIPPKARLARLAETSRGWATGGRDKELGITLKPVLTWKTIVGEVKNIPKGSYVGYDGTRRVRQDTKIAVLPIGYWHGYDRGLSNIGEVLIRGRRAGVLGRIAMDMSVVDVSDIHGVRVGDEAILIGGRGKNAIWADEVGESLGTIAYEILTRINPLIRRVAI